MATEQNRQTRLQKLSGSDYEIVDGQPDIRDWNVKDGQGKKVGEVDELIFDFDSQKVRYLVLDLNDNEYDLDDREVLVPIGIAEIHESDDDVILPGITIEQLKALPSYNEDRFDTEHETNIRNVFGGLGAGVAGVTNENDDFYSHGHFNDTNLYRNRKRNSNYADAETIQSDGNKNRQALMANDEYVKEENIEFADYEELPVVNTEAKVFEKRNETSMDTDDGTTKLDLQSDDEPRKETGRDRSSI